MPISVSRRSPARRQATAAPSPGTAPDPQQFLQQYAEQFRRLCQVTAAWIPRLVTVRHLLVETARRGHKVILVGNGGSAAMASHVAVDLTKNAKIRAVNFNEADLITCFANDFGYDRWLEKAIEHYGEPGDVLIAISSSGKSANILNACTAAKRRAFAAIITFSGFSPHNPLRQLGRENFWVNSRAYNLIEMAHQFWLLALVDLIIGRSEYAAS